MTPCRCVFVSSLSSLSSTSSSGSSLCPSSSSSSCYSSTFASPFSSSFYVLFSCLSFSFTSSSLSMPFFPHYTIFHPLHPCICFCQGRDPHNSRMLHRHDRIKTPKREKENQWKNRHIYSAIMLQGHNDQSRPLDPTPPATKPKQEWSHIRKKE